jgi:hypothetical protein
MPLDVICAGFGRTGTLSLKLALDALGFGPCYHMSEIMADPARLDGWMQVIETGAGDWDAIFQGYRATADWPSVSFLDALAAYYPQSKIILTLRDAESWYESARRTIFMVASEAIADPGHPMSGLVKATVGRDLEGRFDDRNHVIRLYNEHNERVRKAFPPERLLVYKVAEGWEPLCRFLGATVPQTPFPRTNSSEEFVQHRDARIERLRLR